MPVQNRHYGGVVCEKAGYAVSMGSITKVSCLDILQDDRQGHYNPAQSAAGSLASLGVRLQRQKGNGSPEDNFQ